MVGKVTCVTVQLAFSVGVVAAGASRGVALFKKTEIRFSKC
jgi:hypothetical protein